MVDTTLCNCEECPFNGSQKVLGRQYEGSSESPALTDKVLFVGIAPAKTELEEDEPFVGRSGILLRSIIDQLGIDNIYLTNTLLCGIPQDTSAKDTNQALRCCSKRLFEEIKSEKPALIVSLGDIPLKILIGSEFKIKTVEGRIMPSEVGYVLPAVHPAAVLRRNDEFPDLVDAIKAGVKWLTGVYQFAGRPKTVIVTEDNIGEVLQIVENAEVVAVDLETTGKGFYPYARDPDKIRCICMAVDIETAYIVPGESSPHFETHPNLVYHPGLKEVINKSKCVYHNGQFDCGFLLQAGYKPKIYWDTFLAHYMLDEREYSHGLKKLAHKYLGSPDWEEEIKKFLPHKHSSYDLIPDEDLYTYAALDVVYTLQLYYDFVSRIEKSSLYYSLVIPCANMFNELRHRGLRVDMDRLFGLDKTFETELTSAEDELAKLVDGSINPFSPKEVAELVYDKLKFPIIPRFGRSTSKKAFAFYQGEPVIDKILECRELGKLKSTYVVGVANFLDINFRIHPFTKLHGTVSGRVSTEDPSVMNVTDRRGVKELYIAEKDHYILEADGKQMELRGYCVIANDEHLKELLLSNDPEKDPHSMVAKEAAIRTGREIKRQLAKAGVFGRLYGRGLESFMAGYRLDEQQAKGLLSTVDSLFPAIKKYNQQVRKEIHQDGYLESYFGRKRRFGLITFENKHEIYRMGGNFKVQSMASDVNLYAMLHMYGLQKKFDAVPLFPVHDSIVFDIASKDCIPELRAEIERYTRDLVHGKMDFRYDVKVGPSWGEAVLWK